MATIPKIENKTRKSTFCNVNTCIRNLIHKNSTMLQTLALQYIPNVSIDHYCSLLSPGEITMPQGTSQCRRGHHSSSFALDNHTHVWLGPSSNAIAEKRDNAVASCQNCGQQDTLTLSTFRLSWLHQEVIRNELRPDIIIIAAVQGKRIAKHHAAEENERKDFASPARNYLYMYYQGVVKCWIVRLIVFGGSFTLCCWYNMSGISSFMIGSCL